MPTPFGDPLKWRLGQWNGLGFSGSAVDIPNSVYSVEFVVNQEEIYHKFELISSIIQRVVLTWDGKLLTLQWIERTQEWIVYADLTLIDCERFKLCGPNGRCSMTKHPPCTCMEGFEPRFFEEWKTSD
ncbi:G-type lectin S-receptor-like serine/threonine-protein kinase [Tanacetum coccineum]